MPDSLLQEVFEFSKHFTGLLIDGDYSQARALLCDEAFRKWGVPDLAHAWVSMVEDTEGVVMMPETIALDAMEDWPDRRPGDVGWMYVPVLSEVANEAVSGIVVAAPEGLRLRVLEFGRP